MGELFLCPRQLIVILLPQSNIRRIGMKNYSLPEEKTIKKTHFISVDKWPSIWEAGVIYFVGTFHGSVLSYSLSFFRHHAFVMNYSVSVFLPTCCPAVIAFTFLHFIFYFFEFI